MAKEGWVKATPAPILWVCACCGGVRLCQCEEETKTEVVPEVAVKVQEVT